MPRTAGIRRSWRPRTPSRMSPDETVLKPLVVFCMLLHVLRLSHYCPAARLATGRLQDNPSRHFQSPENSRDRLSCHHASQATRRNRTPKHGCEAPGKGERQPPTPHPCATCPRHGVQELPVPPTRIRSSIYTGALNRSVNQASTSSARSMNVGQVRLGASTRPGSQTPVNAFRVNSWHYYLIGPKY